MPPRKKSAKKDSAPPPTKSAAPPPRPTTTVDVPFAGHYCCVYVDEGSDFFRPSILEGKLGGWYPSRVVRVRKLTMDEAAEAAASPYYPYYQHEDYEYDAPVYDISVVSDFFSGRKRFHFPNPYVVLTEPADEPYASFSLLHDDQYVIFQAQPRKMGPGDVVFARYQAGDKWYRGRIVDVYEEEEGEVPTTSMKGTSSEPNKPAGTTRGGGDNNGVAVAAAPAVAAVAAATSASAPVGPIPFRRPVHLASADTSRAVVASNTAAPKGKKLLCSIAYDGEGRGTVESHVPYQDGSDDDDASDSDDDKKVPDGYVVPKYLPYVYLAERGTDDMGWIQLELERMRQCRELLPLTIDQQVPMDPPVAAASVPWHVVPVMLEQLEGKQGGKTVQPDNDVGYFKYEDVVKGMFDVAMKRHSRNKQLRTVVWPTERRIQKKGGGKSKNDNETKA